jgi:hypothetical protein
MACTHTNINCGCKDSFLTTPAPCPTPEGCPDPQPCSEVFDAQCIVYTGDPIICGETTIVATNDTVADALNAIVDYFCQVTPPPPVVSYNCVDCNCVQVQGTGGEFATLSACEAACQYSSPCGVSTSCEDLQLCIPCEGCMNPLQYLFNTSLTLFCNDSCYCAGVYSTPLATGDPDPFFDPSGVFEGNYYYEITFTTGPTLYYLWYSNTDGKWYLTSALGSKTNIFASLTRDGSCPFGTYTSLASPITSFIVDECIPA